jgi:hypothetical protein
VTIQGVKITPYLIGDSPYPLCTYLQKSWKSHNSNDVNKKRYDNSMNFARVIIENVFWSLKNRWWILKNFNSSVNRAPTIAIACFVLHNYCEMWKIPKPGCVNDAERRNNLARYKVDRLPTLRDGKQAKQEGELMKNALFEQWLIDHS